MAEVVLTDEAKADLKALDGATQRLVLKAMVKLKDPPEQRGLPLGSRNMGNLTGFRKLVVGDRDYRIIYRVEADGSVVVVWVVGKRADAEVYAAAVARLQARRGGSFWELPDP